MQLTSLVVVAGLAATGAPPELVILPPAPSGVDQKTALDAWGAVIAQFEQAQGQLGLSLALHNEARDALEGPGREQAWDCRGQTPCLAELGSTLGANLLVSGTITPEEVTLTVLDVAERKKVTGAKSSRKLINASPRRKASAAARGLIKAYQRSMSSAPQAGANTDLAQPKPEGINGMIRIADDQLKDVVSVTVDGASLVRRADGTMIWMGAPGDHQVVAQRNDGARFSKDLFVEPQQITQLQLDWSQATAAADVPGGPFAFEDYEEEEGVTQKWWFWAGVGGAVLAGGVASLALLGGGKGGPSIPGNVGSISGTY